MKSLLTLALAGLAICGCSRSSAGPPQLQTLPVKGTITLDGSPLAGADVVFIVGEPPNAFGGRTKEDGTYELQGRAGLEAALKGNCKVMVSRLVKPDGSLPRADEPPADSGAAEQIPTKYSRPDSTVLTAVIPDGGGTFDFPLTSK